MTALLLEHDAVEEFAFRYGRCFDSYLVTEPDRKHFWSRDRQGVVEALSNCRKYVKISGGLIAPDAGEREGPGRTGLSSREQRKLFLSVL